MMEQARARLLDMAKVQESDDKMTEVKWESQETIDEKERYGDMSPERETKVAKNRRWKVGFGTKRERICSKSKRNEKEVQGCCWDEKCDEKRNCEERKIPEY